MSGPQEHESRGRKQPAGKLLERVWDLFTPRAPVPEEQVLAARLLNGLLLTSFPVIVSAIAVDLTLGYGQARPGVPALPTLLALAAADVVGGLILRSGRVHFSGFWLAFALWAAGILISRSDLGHEESPAMIATLAVVIAYVVLPRPAGLFLTGLSLATIWLFAAGELHGILRPAPAHPVTEAVAGSGILLLASSLAFILGRILNRAARRAVEAQRSLSLSEKELSSILKRTPDIIYRLDAEGRIVYANDAIRRYGYEPSKVVGAHPLDYVHPDDREVATRSFDQRRSGETGTVVQEVRLLTAGGEEVLVESITVPIWEEPVVLLQHDRLRQEGPQLRQFAGTQGIVRDITDRRRAEEALRKSAEQYRKVFQAAPAGIAIATVDGARLVDVNEQFEKVVGYRRAELIGHSTLDLGLWTDPGLRERAIDRLKEGEPVRDVEGKIGTKNGDVRMVRASVHLFDFDGTPCLLIALEDITDRKRLESQLQQAQKLEAIGRLAGGIAHDFNNMLAVILGQAEIASRDMASMSPGYESIQEIRKAAERSAELTRQLLTFARKQDAALQPLSLNHVISERLGIMQRLIGESVALKWSPGPDLWTVKMDPAQLDQILINLTVNARDAISDTGTLTIATGNRLREGAPPQRAGGERHTEWVLLTFSDTGTGMSPKTLARLFEPFFTTKEIGKGTGMGLATIHGIVQQSGGWIEVESEVGSGTTFRIYLPKALDPSASANEACQIPLAFGREAILVVDDEPAILKFIRMTLQRLGYAVIPAASAQEALAAVARHDGPLHLLLSDIVMPEMNGRDLYEKIAVSRPGIRVILMSGYSADILSNPGRRREDISVLQKPFTMQQLSAKVREALDRGQDDQP